VQTAAPRPDHAKDPQAAAPPRCARPGPCPCETCRVDVAARHDAGERAAVLAERRLANPFFSPREPALPASMMGGAAVPERARRRVADATGIDLDGPRLRSEPAAQAQAAALDAPAFAFGGSIFLGAGTRPDDVGILAHEAAHLAQDAGTATPVVHRYEPNLLRLDLSHAAVGLIPVAELGDAIRGPLRAGEYREDHGLQVFQRDAAHAEIELGNSRITIAAHPGEAYSYFIEPLRLPDAAPAPQLELGLQLGALDNVLELPPESPRPQRVVRIAAMSGVHVGVPHYTDGPHAELVAHVRWVAAPSFVDALGESVVGSDVREVPLDHGGALLQLDWSWLRITPPAPSTAPIQPLYEPYADPRYAYWIEPAWSGPDRKHKAVHVVASPGVTVRQYRPDDRMIAPELGDYGRELVPVIVRVPHSSMVPTQGDAFDAGALVGTTAYAPFPASQSGPPELLATAAPSGAAAIEHASGAVVTIRPEDPERGAAFAWDVTPREADGTQIRIVVARGTVIEVDEPFPAGTKRGTFGEVESLDVHLGAVTLIPGAGLSSHGISLEIIEVDDPAQVPRQGTPLNMNYYRGLGRPRSPDTYRWAEELGTVDETFTDVVLTGFSFVPIAGDLKDIAEFVYGLSTGKDFLGRELSTTDKVVMGIGAVIGLIPIVGDLIGKGLRAAVRVGSGAIDVARAARTVGTTPARLEVVLFHLRGAVDGADAEAVERVTKALRRGSDIPVDDLERLHAVLRRVGAGDELLAASRYAPRSPLVIVDTADEAAQIGRRAPEVDAWYRGLNAETRAMLQADPALARAYEGMDPVARRLLTRCGSACIPQPAPSDALQARIKAFADQAKVPAGSFQERQVRAYLRARHDHLEDAIGALERRATDSDGLTTFLARQQPADIVLLERPRLITDPAVRKAINAAVAEGVDIQVLSRIADNVKHLNTPRVIEHVRQLARLRREGVTGTEVVMESLARGGNWARGADWVLRYLDSIEWRGVTRFEEYMSSGLGGRYIDVIIGDVRFQLKSWNEFRAATFVEQIEKDFDLSGRSTAGFRWVFEARAGLPDQAAVIAAAETALRDALAGGRTKLTAEEIGDLIRDLPTIIEVR
jgi:hypothetical protein